MPVSLSTVSGKSIMLSVSCVERGVTRGAGTSVFTPDRDVMFTAGIRKSQRPFLFMTKAFLKITVNHGCLGWIGMGLRFEVEVLMLRIRCI